MSFAQPFWLSLFTVFLFFFVYRRKIVAQGKQNLPIRFSVVLQKADTLNWRTQLKPWLPWLRWLAIGSLIIAMARPQRKWQEEKINADAIDIMMAMDISPSMLSRDFDPDRLAVAKKVAIDFVQKRPYDRIGLAAFSAEAFTQCPLTTDRKVMESYIKELSIGRLEDGTAIGMGLATAINRLKDSPSKSKIVILLTDGENNAGYIDPMKAAEIAKSLSVKVYTVGIGTDGVVMSPASRNNDGSYIFAPRYTSFNTALLEQIADLTEGKFYRAYSEDDLTGIYAEIDRLEKTKVEVTTIRRTTDYFQWFIGIAAVLLLFEVLLQWGLLRSVNM